MIIDFHAHLAPADPAAPPFMRHLFDVDGYLEQQAQAGIQLTVLSYAMTDIEGTDADLDEAKKQHEFLADLVARHPQRFVALATVDPFGGSAWLAEAERALRAGFSGLCLPTSRLGRYLDADDAQDAFAFANEKRAVVFLHPSDSPIDIERAGDMILRDWIGRPYDTGICLSRLLLAGTLARYPDLRVVVAHCGGPLPMFLGRLDSVYETFERRAALMGGRFPGGGGPPGGGPPPFGPPGGGPSLGPPGGRPPFGPPGPTASPGAALKPALDGKPSESASKLYVDTANYHPVAVRAAIDTFGIDRVVLGTDYPPANRSPKPSVDLIMQLGLPPEQRDKILFGNARALLELSQKAGAAEAR